jgi:hypothetical protein
VCLVPEYDGGGALSSVRGRDWGGATGRHCRFLVRVGAPILGSGGVAFNLTSCTIKSEVIEVGLEALPMSSSVTVSDVARAVLELPTNLPTY